MIMELNEFLEKFLGNDKLSYFKKLNKKLDNTYDAREALQLVYDMQGHFYEALQNYTDRICEKQRENCTIVSKYYVNSVNTTFDNFLKEMRNAEQPKIEEI